MAGKNKKKRCILSKAIGNAASKLERRPPEAPNNLKDVGLSLAELVRFFYAVLGKWHLLDPPRAIIYTALDKGMKTIAMECGERSDCEQLKHPKMLNDLYEFIRCLEQTILVSKKRFRSRLSDAGFDKEDILLRKGRARILKPAFTVIRDKEAKCILVIIRGTCSLTDTLTDAMGAPVSFEHKFISSDGEVRIVSGHAHRGMVSAANWIRERCTSLLLDALRRSPDFQIKIVGHSLGGGTAALLTYNLREIKELSSCTCITFGPAACMTLELAEFGKPFITSIINGCDMVPTLSASSIHNFISEGRSKRKVFLKGARRSINTFGSRLVTRDTKAGMKNKHRTIWGFPWRRKNRVTLSRSQSENLDETCGSSKSCCEPLLTPSDEDESYSPTEGSDNYDEEEQITSATQNITAPTVYGISVDEVLNKFKELELEARDNIPRIRAKEKEEVKNNDMTEETNKVVHSEESAGTVTTPKNLDRHLFPPGRIMHIVSAAPSYENSDSNENDHDEKQVYLYETPIQLYGKLRLSRRMILDHMMRKYMKVLEQLINQLEN